jgi:hypothetical protein
LKSLFGIVLPNHLHDVIRHWTPVRAALLIRIYYSTELSSFASGRPADLSVTECHRAWFNILHRLCREQCTPKVIQTLLHSDSHIGSDQFAFFK